MFVDDFGGLNKKLFASLNSSVLMSAKSVKLKVNVFEQKRFNVIL